MIRRSTASILNFDKAGKKIPMKSMIPAHDVQTVSLEYRSEEAAEAEWIHRVYARSVCGFVLIPSTNVIKC